MVFELFLCELDGYIYIKSMLVIYFNCMSHYMDFNACFFRGDFSANECSCDISNWFEWKCTGDSREIYVCRCLGKLLQNADWGYWVISVEYWIATCLLKACILIHVKICLVHVHATNFCCMYWVYTVAGTLFFFFFFFFLLFLLEIWGE